MEPGWTGKNAWNPRGFIAQNPRKVRGVHALRGFDGNLMYYHYLCTRRESTFYMHKLYTFVMQGLEEGLPYLPLRRKSDNPADIFICKTQWRMLQVSNEYFKA